jgi:hypothetical protein
MQVRGDTSCIYVLGGSFIYHETLSEAEIFCLYAGQVPLYFVCACIRTWESITFNT